MKKVFVLRRSGQWGQTTNITVDNDITVRVYAVDETWGTQHQSPCIAQFNLKVQKDAAFMRETDNGFNQSERRNPQDHDDKYEYLTGNDFDMGYNTSTPLTAANNAWLDPLPAEWETAYGFVYPRLNTIYPFVTPKWNHYGLYRSAEYSEGGRFDNTAISTSNSSYNVSEWGEGRTYSENASTSRTNRTYEWFFRREVSNSTFFDRTHAEEASKYGFFYYVDASVQPGRIISVPFNETLCGGTELTIIAS